MQKRVDNSRIVICCHCMVRMVIYPCFKRMVHVLLKVACGQLRTGAGVCVCSVKGKREQSHHYVCTTLMSIWITANCGCLAKELLVSLSKACHVLWSVLHILQNDPPSPTQMDGPCVKYVDCTMCSVTLLVRCFLRQSVIPYCSILPKYEKESENPSPRSSLTFHVFAQLSHLVAMRQGVCCFYLDSCCKYALFSFLKWR